MKKIEVELNDDFRRALRLFEEPGKHVFVTGKAGTGKSTLLSYWRSRVSLKIAVLAPTGVAALNIGGQTIHSFFRFKPGVSIDQIKKIKGKRSKLYRGLDAIVIDEISMVRADLLDMIDLFLRLNGPDSRSLFGGVKMIFIGDLYQLPPVVASIEKPLFQVKYPSPYFFDANVIKNGFTFEFVELKKIYRQKDEVFVRILNCIRNNSVDEIDLMKLNKQVGAVFKGKSGYSIQLTTTNQMAEIINQEYLDELSGKIFTAEALIQGECPQQYFPTQTTLSIKSGAQVMMLNNDSQGRWVNGTLGKVVRIIDRDEINRGSDDSAVIWVEFENGNQEEVVPYTWDIMRYILREKDNNLISESVGSFTQYPLKLAWAVTIHKSQGKTFNRIVVDIGKGTFAHGQAYVALSRCTSLAGISLKRPFEKRHILLDRRIVDFVARYQQE